MQQKYLGDSHVVGRCQSARGMFAKAKRTDATLIPTTYLLWQPSRRAQEAPKGAP